MTLIAEHVLAHLALGSNAGERERQLELARARLAAEPGLRIVAASRIYETEPVGPEPQGRYLNAALALHCTLPARELLARMLEIERGLGRVRDRGQRWGPRTIDLDLLLYGDVCIEEPGLELPHPRLHERAFVLEPLAELAAELRHPRLGGSIREYRDACRDVAAVKLWRAEAGSRGWSAEWP